MATKSIRLSNGTDTLLPESAVSGTNYCKMADGTLIQWNKTTVSVPANSSYTPEITFPLTFNAVPTVSATARMGGASNMTYNGLYNAPTTSAFTTMFVSTRTSALNVVVEWQAIGRWK